MEGFREVSARRRVQCLFEAKQLLKCLLVGCSVANVIKLCIPKCETGV